MIDRSVVICGRGTMMAAAALAAGLSMMSPAAPIIASGHKRKKYRPKRQADRSRKQYLLKGIRP